ncbi:MAG: hypothetical protein J1E77_08190 [Prevotella sp.]|nr:hypothetical protein [Prevotella sp.]
MKKLVFMFVAVAAISFASCGGNQNQQAAPEAEVDEVIEEVADSLAGDSIPADSGVVAEEVVE